MRKDFHIFNFLIFQVVREGRAKNSPKWQKILSCSISHEPYIIWSSFVVCKCKIIFSDVFFIFSELWFFRLLRGSKGKEWPKMTKNSVCCALYLRNHTSYDLHLWYTCVIGSLYVQVFLHLFQIFIFGVNSGVKGQNLTYLTGLGGLPRLYWLSLSSILCPP